MINTETVNHGEPFEHSPKGAKEIPYQRIISPLETTPIIQPIFDDGLGARVQPHAKNTETNTDKKKRNETLLASAF